MALGGLKARLLAGAALMFVAGPAMAADLSSGGSLKDAPVAASDITATGYIQGTNDYIFRGLSQNRQDGAGQGGVDLAYGMWYLGTFASNVDFKGDYNGAPSTISHASAEVDLYAGIKPKVGDVTFDLGVITYNYIGASSNHPTSYDPTYQEFKAGASITVLKDLALSGTAYYSPNYFGETGPAVTVEGTASKPIAKIHDVDVAVSGTVGHTFYENSVANGASNYDYTYGNVGGTLTYKAVSLDLRWWDTDLSKNMCDGSVFQCGSAFAGTLKYSF